MAKRTYDKYNKYIERLQKCFSQLDKIEEEMDNDINCMSSVDKEVGDYLHKIEAEDEIKNPKTILHKMRDARRRRREIKVIMGVLKKYRQLAPRLNNKANRRMLIAELHKEVKSQLKNYNYRVLEGEDNEGIYKPTDDEQTE